MIWCLFVYSHFDSVGLRGRNDVLKPCIEMTSLSEEWHGPLPKKGNFDFSETN